jgi:hypothetical protein
MLVRPFLTSLFALGLGLVLSAGAVWAQDDGTPSADQPEPAALSGPVFNDQIPSQCTAVPWDAPKDPNARWVYTCSYPNGDIATWRSETDSTLLAYRTGCNPRTCAGEPQTTPEGHAYLDGPEPGAPDTGAVPAASAAVTAAQSAALALKGFPGAVLLLPFDEAPYASWPFQGIRVDPGPSYMEYAGDPLPRIGSDVLSIQASFGQSGDDPRSGYKPVCQSTTPYCYFPPFGQSSGTEIFNGLKARGADAFVLHKTFPYEIWSLSWFDKASNTSYTLSFGGDDVITIFEPPGTFNKSNVTAAQKLAAMADKLIPWTAT